MFQRGHFAPPLPNVAKTRPPRQRGAILVGGCQPEVGRSSLTGRTRLEQALKGCHKK
jgi:hypothetical protein